MVKALGLFLGQHKHLLRPLGELVEPIAHRGWLLTNRERRSVPFR
jgi:hypothetical protein